ncbi:hypothetical protein FA13DRAFT_1451952 [Coprinellus micaceus]|uniref:Uncharacterized protein n=1 Tax=Coprinellus micaceus TaxID=71717 RepID=A0A4Y7SNC8_COPMI|nr:hypothetical protein FA13DRAFT_1451952 [Coprinellus micaceus]
MATADVLARSHLGGTGSSTPSIASHPRYPFHATPSELEYLDLEETAVPAVTLLRLRKRKGRGGGSWKEGIRGSWNELGRREGWSVGVSLLTGAGMVVTLAWSIVDSEGGGGGESGKVKVESRKAQGRCASATRWFCESSWSEWARCRLGTRDRDSSVGTQAPL